MRVAFAAACLLLGGCTWSNSLYMARSTSAEALRAERENRPGDAENAWGRAAEKAESAYVRAPASSKAAEALWLQGRARARTRDCVRASAALERSALLRRDAPWREALMLELATCRELMQDRGAVALYEQLASSGDSTVRGIARRRAGEALVRDGRWEEALVMLAQLTEPRARLQRAVALASLGRPDDAMAEARSLTPSDTSLDFVPLVRALSSHSNARTEELLALLLAVPRAPAQSRWLLAAAQGAALHDPTASDGYLARLVQLTPDPSVSTGALLATDRIVARATSPANLRLRLDSLTGFVDDALPRLRAEQLRRSATALLTEEAATAAGAPQGDLVIFVLGETARDSLAAPLLASWLFSRMERDWPQSPYLAKGMLARLALIPDSGDVLRARLALLPPSPYLAYLQGAQDAGFVRLEDSLRLFLRDRARAASGRRTNSAADAALP